MDTKTKWLLKKKLSYHEALEIMKELYNGSKKKFNFVTDKPVDQVLFKLYNDFNTDTETDLCFTFSNQETNKPFVSIVEIENSTPTHTIQTEEFCVYIYE